MRKHNDFGMSEILVALCLNDGRYWPYRLFFPSFSQHLQANYS